ncbi:Chaperone protein DnaJ [Symbiodinium microadriaticum]|uniref:Chaperone protein DnaJ n=1 Tax=Symbiodinium microadriaticum TaxID=2951 RepID=A0A1Q9D2X7_SYMMI|nr:Chaperone protein DnaJ [Symbiodinium microadriaticum]
MLEKAAGLFAIDTVETDTKLYDAQLVNGPRRLEANSQRRRATYFPSRYLSVLGIPKEASVAEIKKALLDQGMVLTTFKRMSLAQAYYRNARDSHPDKFPGDEKMRERFQEVADAYATLADPARRQKYDLQGLAGLAFFRQELKVLIGRTDHWLWEEDRADYMVGLLASAIPNGIAGVTVKGVQAAYKEAYDTRVGTLLERCSEEQARDTVDQLEEAR